MPNTTPTILPAPSPAPSTPRFKFARFVLAIAVVVAIPPVMDGVVVYGSTTNTFANALPWLLLWSATLAVTRRPLASAAWTSLVAAGVYGSHQLKLQHLNLPLLPGDVFALKQLLTSPEMLVRYVRFDSRAAALVLAVLVLTWHERPAVAARGLARRVTLAISGTLIGAMLFRLPPMPQIYSYENLRLSYWTPVAAARESGAIVYLLFMRMNSSVSLPIADTDVLAAADAFLARQSDRVRSDPNMVRPDVIVIQSESFFDPGRLNGLDSRDYLPNLTALQARHAHGNLKVPTFGGLTTRTEFEFLTGFPLAGTPDLSYPYQAVVHSAMPALPWTLKQMGYTTHAVHPYDGGFYGRNAVFPLLGFDHFHTGDEFPEADRHGYHISDAALSRRVRELLNSDSQQFVFAVSVENHGPWDPGRKVDAVNLPIAVDASAGDAATELTFGKYLHHLRRSDAALGELAAWVMQRERATLLLFFGDHLPGLGKAYERWPPRDGHVYYEQPVPWILVDNRGDSAQQLDMDSSQLAAWMLRQAGIATDPHFNAIETLRARADAAGIDAALRAVWQQHLASRHLGSTYTAAELAAPD